MLLLIIRIAIFIAIIAILIASAFFGKNYAAKNDKSVPFLFITGLLTGPIGLAFIYIFAKLPEKLAGIFISILVFIIAAILFTNTEILKGLESSAIDFRFFIRDPEQIIERIREGDGVKGKVSRSSVNVKARDDIVIIAIDESTIREFSDNGIQWPFPWKIHAQLTNFLSTGNPLAIFFDIMFIDHKPGEVELAKAIKNSGCSFLDYPFETKEVEKQYADRDERLKLLDNVKFPLDPNDNYIHRVQDVTPPLPAMIQAARGIGFANIFPGRDGIDRTMPLIMKFNGSYYPNIDLIVAMRYYGIGVEDVEIKIGEYIKLKNLPKEKMAKPNNKREVMIPIDEFGSMDVNFIGSSGSYKHYSYSMFAQDGTMKGNDSFKDKMLLVAAYSVTGIATDEKKSPYGPIFGIENHANALNTILNQDFIFKLSDFQNIIILLTIALLLGFLVPRMSIGISLVTTVVLVVAYFFISIWLFSSHSIITAFSTPLIQTAVIYSMLVTYRVVNEQQEKKHIRQTFSKFVSKSVVDELLQDPSKIKLGGDKKLLTVLFSDIRGFTSISEKFTPEGLVEHLNIYLQGMTDTIIKYDGTLDKYIGDAVKAFWGAPIEMEDHALNACKSAIEMIHALHGMNRKWRHENKPTLNIGIGINTGDMVVGNMGSNARMDYTIMGDNVNLGSRLEGATKFYKVGIIISESTYQYVKDDIIARELDLIRVKGKELPVKIYELIAMKH
ncbi:MAG: adenylate/guanylate cyclase domain-containing protein [Leptospirales bacterium]|nr:adenylate/guanylate cyclase domain-containing protein [Leptospirales bacterium]